MKTHFGAAKSRALIQTKLVEICAPILVALPATPSNITPQGQPGSVSGLDFSRANKATKMSFVSGREFTRAASGGWALYQGATLVAPQQAPKMMRASAPAPLSRNPRDAATSRAARADALCIRARAHSRRNSRQITTWASAPEALYQGTTSVAPTRPTKWTGLQPRTGFVITARL